MFACPFLGLSAFFRASHLVYRGLTRAARDAEPGKMDGLLGLKMNYTPMNLFILFRNNWNIKPTVQRARA